VWRRRLGRPEVHGYDVFEDATSDGVIDAPVLGAGRGWERGDERFTLVFVTLDDQRLAVTLATRRR
jgi:hypothetical protein